MEKLYEYRSWIREDLKHCVDFWLEHGMDPVYAGTDHTPQAARAKGKLPVKPVPDGIHVTLDGAQLSKQGGIVHSFSAPEKILFQFFHMNSSFAQKDSLRLSVNHIYVENSPFFRSPDGDGF